jgi:hypothetical protein
VLTGLRDLSTAGAVAASANGEADLPHQAIQRVEVGQAMFSGSPAEPLSQSYSESRPNSLRYVSRACIDLPVKWETVAQALEGEYRPVHLFTLKQSLVGYCYYQQLIAELDDVIAPLMHIPPNATQHPSPIPKRTKRTHYSRMRNDPLFDDGQLGTTEP